MGLVHSCLGKKNKVGVLNEEETEAYEKAQHLIVVDELNKAKGGVAFELIFGNTAKSKQPPNLLVSSQKDESFEKWRENQEKIQEEKQKKAQEKRSEARVLKQIENAQKEIDRLDKYVNQQGSL